MHVKISLGIELKACKDKDSKVDFGSTDSTLIVESSQPTTKKGDLSLPSEISPNDRETILVCNSLRSPYSINLSLSSTSK